MANDSFDAKVKEVMEKKVVQKVVELQRAVALTAFQYITANSLEVGMAYGSPVLTGRYYTSHTISLNTIDTSVKPPNPDGEEHPYKGLSLSTAVGKMQGLKLGDTVYIANSLPYALRLEEGYSRFKAPEGIYHVSVEAVVAKFKNVRDTLGIKVTR